MNKKMKTATVIVMGVALVFALLVVYDQSGGKIVGKTSRKTEEQIVQILYNTKVNKNWSPTIGSCIIAVFHNYEITVKPCQESKTQYVVTFSGDYCPNPRIPNLSQSGSITYLVDTASGSCRVLYDRDNITSTFMVYIVS